MNLIGLALSMLRSYGKSFINPATGKTFMAVTNSEDNELEFDPAANLEPGDSIEGPACSYLLLAVIQTNQLPKACIARIDRRATAVRSIEGKADSFGRPPRTEQVLWESVPVVFHTRHLALTPARYGIRPGDFLRFSDGDEQAVTAVRSAEGISRLSVLQLGDGDLAELIFRA